MIDAVASEWLKLRSLRSNLYLLAFSTLSVLVSRRGSRVRRCQTLRVTE